MKKTTDVTDWLSQTIDISKYFIWSPGLWDKDGLLYKVIFASGRLLEAGTFPKNVKKHAICQVQTGGGGRYPSVESPWTQWTP